ncbi:MAG: OmpA family protein [Rhodobacteraceae bacterium]|nr:OmpA family protein [Paracoccaceae bacterium]
MHRLSSNLIAPIAIVLAAILCVLAALLSVSQIEQRTGAAVRAALAEQGIAWASVVPDGTLVHLTGTAPDEAARFRALSATGAVVDSARLLDEVEVTPSTPVAAPRFSVELLRNDTGITVIGLIPRATEREALARDLSRIAGKLPVTDMLESADHAMPEGWDDALDFGLKALEELKRAKISINARRVAVTAISDSQAEKQRLERDLRRAAPKGLVLALDISAPRPVIAPFSLRFLMDDEGARFDACAADTDAAAERILAAAKQAGMIAPAECPLGLGVPAPSWGAAVERGIAALATLGAGSLTFSDADVTLIAAPGTDTALFEKTAAELEADLPDLFVLHAVLPDPVKVDGTGGPTGPAEFVATLSPEGLVQLRGRVPDALVREAAESYARARFGRDKVYAAMRIDPNLPEGWPLRVLAGLEALSNLRNGSVIVQAGYLQLTGLTMDDTATARVSRMLSDRLGEAQNFEIDIDYREPPKTEETRPTAEACVAQIGEILAGQKIIFSPGSTMLEGDSVRVVDQIADVLRGCPGAEIEIGGHTDSQGREEMNQQLSQARAEAVLTALMARRVLTSNLTAKGYGESNPIADNDTEEGREANRRIEFRLIAPETTPDEDEDDAASQGNDATSGDQGAQDGQD